MQNRGNRACVQLVLGKRELSVLFTVRVNGVGILAQNSDLRPLPALPFLHASIDRPRPESQLCHFVAESKQVPLLSSDPRPNQRKENDPWWDYEMAWGPGRCPLLLWRTRDSPACVSPRAQISRREPAVPALTRLPSLCFSFCSEAGKESVSNTDDRDWLLQPLWLPACTPCVDRPSPLSLSGTWDTKGRLWGCD